MAELRTIHLGAPAPPRDSLSVMVRLAAAYAAAAPWTWSCPLQAHADQHWLVR